MPNCVVDVRFDEVSGHFSYACSNSTRGWQVYPDGGIYPAILGREVQFRIKNDPGTAIKLAGFQISKDELGAVPPSHRWPALPPGDPEDLVNPGVGSVPPDSFPTQDSNETFSELTFKLGVRRWFYRLAVVVEENGEPIWDEPSIHDDGSQ